MKIIKSRLKQIIKEELEAVSQIRVPVKEPNTDDKKHSLGEADLGDVLNRYKELVMDIQGVLDLEARQELNSNGALIEIQSLIDEEGGSRESATDADIGNMGDAIAEEEGDDTLSTEPTDNDQADVDRILRYLPNINHPAEYAKVLVAVLNWGASGKVPQITKSLKAASQEDDAFYQTLIRHLKLLKHERGG